MFRQISVLILISITLTLQAFSEDKTPIAILDLEGKGVSQTDANSITDRIRHELFQTGQFRVLEREMMEEILSEQGFQLAGCTSSECAVEAGRILGVKKMVAGSVNRLGSLYTLFLRMIDVESGEIIASSSVDCRCEIEEVAVKSTKEAVGVLIGEYPFAAGEYSMNQDRLTTPVKPVEALKTRKWGIKWGLNRCSYDESAISPITTQVFGIYTNFFRVLRLELLYIQKGGLEDDYGWYTEAPTSVKSTINYLEIPLIVRLPVFKKKKFILSVIGGVYYDYFLAYNIVLNGYNQTEHYDIKGFNNDKGVIAGIELEHGNFVLEFRNSYGMNDNNNGAILHISSYSTDNSLLEDYWHNQVMTLSLAYKIF